MEVPTLHCWNLLLFPDCDMSFLFNRPLVLFFLSKRCSFGLPLNTHKNSTAAHCVYNSSSISFISNTNRLNWSHLLKTPPRQASQLPPDTLPPPHPIPKHSDWLKLLTPQDPFSIQGHASIMNNVGEVYTHAHTLTLGRWCYETQTHPPTEILPCTHSESTRCSYSGLGLLPVKLYAKVPEVRLQVQLYWIEFIIFHWLNYSNTHSKEAHIL